jgi:tRNA(fMet)-specific endonuclease VapC
VRDFLLDTQTVHYWYDSKCPQNQAVVANIESLREQVESLEHKPRLLVSVITLGEIEFGHRVNPPPNPDVQAEYLKFVSEQLPVPLEVTEDAAAIFGELRKRLFDAYAPGEKRKPKMRPEQLIDPITSKELGIQENDLWLCAQAVAHGMVLVTNDAMRRIREVSHGMQPALLIQNWTIPNAAKVE